MTTTETRRVGYMLGTGDGVGQPFWGPQGRTHTATYPARLGRIAANVAGSVAAVGLRTALVEETAVRDDSGRWPVTRYAYTEVEDTRPQPPESVTVPRELLLDLVTQLSHDFSSYHGCHPRAGEDCSDYCGACRIERELADDVLLDARERVRS